MASKADQKYPWYMSILVDLMDHEVVGKSKICRQATPAVGKQRPARGPFIPPPVFSFCSNVLHPLITLVGDSKLIELANGVPFSLPSPPTSHHLSEFSTPKPILGSRRNTKRHRKQLRVPTCQKHPKETQKSSASAEPGSTAGPPL